MSNKISKGMETIQGSIIREIFKAAADSNIISLAGGNPSPETFPGEELAEIARDLLEQEPTLSLQYGITEGYPELRDKVREMLKLSEHIEAPEDQLLMLSGAQQCMYLAAKVLLDPGDTIIVENPSFIGSMNAFRSFQPNMVGVPVEEDGMDMVALEKALKENDNVKFIYTIPTYQNPTGITMSLEKRKRLYQLAAAHGVYIIEDNPYGELIFEGQKLPTLKSMDTEDLVIYAGSFSKILSPGMRLGYVLGPADICGRMTIAKQMVDVHTSITVQLIALEYMKRYDIFEHIRKARKIYAAKAKCMMDCLEKYLPASVSYTKPNGGLFIWCTMPEGYDSMKVSEICAANNVAFVPGNAFMVDMNAPSNCFRLNYSSMDQAGIEEGVRTLGDTLKSVIK